MAGFVAAVSVFWLMVCPPEEWAYATGLLGIALGGALFYREKRSQ